MNPKPGLNPATEPSVGSGPSWFSFSAASHSAAWAGLYVVGAVACFVQVAGIDASIAPRASVIAAAFAFSTAVGVYLLDRVKLRDTWLDPADALAHPCRFAFIAGRARSVRLLVVVLLGVAAWLGSILQAWGAAVPLLAAAGVLVYAARPRARRPRPKDIVLIKNLYVALGITGFGTIVGLAAARPGADLDAIRDVAVAHGTAVALSIAHLVVRVFADAVLCDLDDEDADRRFRTETLPTHLGRSRAWNIAVAVRLCTAAALVALTTLPVGPRLAWAGVTVASSITLRVAAPSRVRDWVDVRFAAEAVCVAVILMWLRSR